MIDKIKSVLFGLAVGDALGVPVEFKTREYLKRFPVKGIIGHGTWNQPPGTFSDDSSLAMCLGESLTKEYNLDDIAQNFINWMQHGYWGAHYKVFDVGGATRHAIGRLIKGESPLFSGGMLENDNGNGSLMRIIPFLFYIKDLSIEERYLRIQEVSGITHAHFRSVFACFIFMEMALQILLTSNAESAYQNMKTTLDEFIKRNEFSPKELALFQNVLVRDIKKRKEKDIGSGGYVIDTLEAAIWCLLNTDDYTDAVLKAVNLGGDTDTTACVTGGLAGLLYGFNEIPQVWIGELARKEDIEDLCERLNKNVK